MERGPPIGSWVCCHCRQTNLRISAPDRCPVDGHYKCGRCYVNKDTHVLKPEASKKLPERENVTTETVASPTLPAESSPDLILNINEARTWAEPLGHIDLAKLESLSIETQALEGPRPGSATPQCEPPNDFESGHNLQTSIYEGGLIKNSADGTSVTSAHGTASPSPPIEPEPGITETREPISSLHTSEAHDATYPPSDDVASRTGSPESVEDPSNASNKAGMSASDNEVSGSDGSEGDGPSQATYASWSTRDQPITTDPTTADLGTTQTGRMNDSKQSGAEGSIYTGGSEIGLDDAKKVRLTEWFVHNILKDLEDVIVPHGGQLDMAGYLLTYQKALRLRSTSELERIFTRFVRRRRARIVEMMALEQLAVNSTQTAVNWQSKIDAAWLSFTVSDGDPNLPADRPQDIDLSNLGDTEPEYGTDSPELDAAKRFLFGGQEYPWLISRLRRECAMLRTGDTPSLIRTELTHALDSSGDLSLKLHWDPVAFVKEQYELSANVRLADVVCVVGNETSAYAATCSDYLELVWSDLGRTVLRFLDAWISEGTPDNYGSPAWTEYGLDCHVSLSNGWLSWSLHAIAAELAVEVCEVVCFLSTVCRSSRPSASDEARIEACSPQIILSQSQDSSQTFLLVEPTYEALMKGTEQAVPKNGACWQAIFWNPVIAVGYPVPARKSSTPGLQISIELFSRLTQITRALIYDDILMLKGFCNMLIPTRVSGSTIVWHYVLNENFAWLSHNEARKACGVAANVDFQMFEAATIHVVGWVTRSRINAGRTDTGFDAIEYTENDVVGSGYAIDGLTINVGKYLGASIKFTPAQKDSRVMHAPAPFYERMINTASGMNVIFYDVTPRRAWLVGGDDALLYLSRAAISHPEGRTPRSRGGTPLHERFKHTNLIASDSPSSQDVLLDENNRGLVIYDNKRDPSKRWHFEDEVGAMFDVLGEISARRARQRSCETKQWEMRIPWSKQFVGIGCLDLISGQQTLCPRCRDLLSTAGHWLKIADAIDSVNIIGAGIAEMIQPSTEFRSSSPGLPLGQDILIAPMGRISRIARMYGTLHPDCVEITRGVFWQDPMASFHAIPCRCGTEEPVGCSEKPVVNLRDRRQTFLRGSRSLGAPLDQLLQVYPTSAIAFSSVTRVAEPRPMVAPRTSSALHQFFRVTRTKSVPVQSFESLTVPGAPPTPIHSPSRSTQSSSDNNRTSEVSIANTAYTTAGNKTSCIPSKAAQIWLLLMKGEYHEAELLIISLLNRGITAEQVDEVCYNSGHRSKTIEHFHESLLSFASRSDNIDFVQYLMKNGFSADRANSLGMSPLEEAASLNNVRMMRGLLKSYPSLRLNKALMITVRAGSKDATEFLLEYGSSLNCELPLNKALQEACDFEHIPLVHCLIMGGADPNIDYARVFRDALANGSADLVGALLKYDIDEALVLAMTDALDDLTLEPGKCREGSIAKLSHLQRKCVEISACSGMDFLDFGESEAESR